MTLNSPYTPFVCSALFCETETLLAQCVEYSAGKEPQSSLWKVIDEECDVGFPTKFSDDDFAARSFSIFTASLGGYLVTMKCPPSEQLIYAHSPRTKSWVPISKIHTWLGRGAVLVSRSSELVIFNARDCNKVLKITLCGKVQGPFLS